METLINSDQAFINIVSRAIENGYPLNKHNSIEETLIEAEDYLIGLITPADKQIYCEVVSHGTSQHVSYADGLGTVYTSDGEIIGYNTYKNALPNEMHVYATIVNVKGEVIELYENLNLTL